MRQPYQFLLTTRQMHRANEVAIALNRQTPALGARTLALACASAKWGRNLAERRQARLIVVGLILVVETAIAVVGGLAGNAAAGQGHWPVLDIVRRHPFSAVAVVAGLTVLIGLAPEVIGRLGARRARRVLAPQARVYQNAAVPAIAESFQERDSVRALRVGLARRGTAVVTQVISGMGGVGKTQLAAHYARTRKVDVLIWVAANRRDSVIAEYARAGMKLADADASDPEVAARQFLAWLEGTRLSWLIVLDDVVSASDLADLWPPRRRRGRTVVTTRRRDSVLLGDGRAPIEVGVFTPAQAVTYLTEKLRAHERREARADLEALAADLGFLPLALAQALAYLVDTRLSCAQYRERLADRVGRLADLVPPDDALPDSQRVGLAATLWLSVQRVDELRPVVARAALEIAAMLDPAGAPGRVFTASPVLKYIAARRAESAHGDVPSTESEARDALALLAQFSLVTLDFQDEYRGVRAHALVQRAARERLGDEKTPAAVRAAADALLSVWPKVGRDTRLTLTLRANAAALKAVGAGALWESAAHPILFRLGNSIESTGLTADAIAYWTELANESTDRLGPDHADTLRALGNLALRRGEAGDAAGTVSALEALYEKFLAALGPDHEHTLRGRGNLAIWRAEAGDASGAATALEALVADCIEILGPDHPITLRTRDNLARARGMSGDTAGAVTLYGSLLSDCLRVLGQDDPATLSIRNNLAHWRGQTGDAVGAVVALEALLRDQSRVFGPENPETLRTRNNLAFWRGVVGDAAGAVKAFEALLADRLRVAGPDHPETLRARNNLARWRAETGDSEGAVKAFEALTDDYLRIHGADHPITLAARGNLAISRGRAGDARGAVEALKLLVADCLRVLGPDHPETLHTSGNLAHWRGMAGDAAGAAEAFKKANDENLRVLGPDHPSTLATRHGLVSWRAEMGHASEAVDALASVVADKTRVLGADHPDTLRAQNDLARRRGLAGDDAGAMAAYKKLAEDRARVLGPDHPDTLATRGNLAISRGRTGDMRGAVKELKPLLADHLRVLGPEHPQTARIRSALDHWSKQRSR